MTDWTSAEIMRRVEELVRSVERLASTMEASYVRKEVYEAKHEALRAATDARIKDLEGDVADLEHKRDEDKKVQEAARRDADNRLKQLAFTVAGSVLASIVVGALAVAGLPGGS